ncbi:MAG: hypothetical protein ACK6D2_11735 [Planctomycetota bacterium]
MTVAPGLDVSLLELALGCGEASALASARMVVHGDPALVIAYAEELAFVQSARLLVCDAGPVYDRKLADVVRQAELRLPPPSTSRRHWLTLFAAAALVFGTLLAWDPLRPAAAPAPRVSSPLVLQAASPMTSAALEVAIDAATPSWGDDIELIRRRLDLEATPWLRASFDDGLQRADDGLRAWLDPRNAVMLAGFDVELRAHAEFRREALLRGGGLLAVDERVQAMADTITAATSEPGIAASDATTLGYAARALVAAGVGEAARREAIVRLGRLLGERLVGAHGGALAAGLAGLLDVALATGEFTADVRCHGDRLVADLLAIESGAWSRRLPALLLSSSPAAVLGEASRVLAWLPAFGAEPNRCVLARSLLVGALRDRLVRGDDGPGVVAAALYGCGDLLTADERTAWERSLRRWKPARLAPDFVLCQQFAAALPAGRAGFARHQAELRELAMVGDPAGLRDRSALCLCLATVYAAHGARNAGPAPRGGA